MVQTDNLNNLQDQIKLCKGALLLMTVKFKDRKFKP